MSVPPPTFPSLNFLGDPIPSWIHRRSVHQHGRGTSPRTLPAFGPSKGSQKKFLLSLQLPPVNHTGEGSIEDSLSCLAQGSRISPQGSRYRPLLWITSSNVSHKTYHPPISMVLDISFPLPSPPTRADTLLWQLATVVCYPASPPSPGDTFCFPWPPATEIFSGKVSSHPTAPPFLRLPTHSRRFWPAASRFSSRPRQSFHRRLKQARIGPSPFQAQR